MKDGALKVLLEGKRWPTDIFAVIILSAMGILSALYLPDGNIVRIIFGTILLILLPGYSLVSVLWPELPVYVKGDKDENYSKSIEKGIGTFERLILSIGLSLVLVPIISLLLDSTWEIYQTSILTYLFVLILALSAIAIFRRRMLPEEQRFSISFYGILENMKPEGEERLDKTITIAIVICLLIASSLLAYMMFMPKDTEFYTDLYILDQNRTIENLPLKMTTNDTGYFYWGVVCHEKINTDYTIVTKIVNETGARQNWTISTDNIHCEVGERVEMQKSFQIPENGTYRLEIVLYKNEESTPNLELHLWIEIRDAWL